MAERIPRDPDDDYTPEAARRRREFLAERTGTTLEHVGEGLGVGSLRRALQGAAQERGFDGGLLDR